jgi:hypothetical protein
VAVVPVSLEHAERYDEPGGGNEGGDRPDGGSHAQYVGDDPGKQCPDGEAAVAPEPVDADRGCPPGGMGDVADGGEQGGVDHGSAGPEVARDRAVGYWF